MAAKVALDADSVRYVWTKYGIEPELPPDYANFGKVRYARWDGGSIAALKAILSGWSCGKDPRYLNAACRWYDTETLECAKKANLNWLWITWSVGFSPESEKHHQEKAAKYINEAKKQGFKISTYMSFTNMFADDMFAHYPQSKDWVQKDQDGELVPYGAAFYTSDPTRYVACISHPEWRRIVMDRSIEAARSGADALEYDNAAVRCSCENCHRDYYEYTEKRFGKAMDLPDSSYPTKLLDIKNANQDVDVSAFKDNQKMLEWRILNQFWAEKYSVLLSEIYERAKSVNPDIFVYRNSNIGAGPLGFPVCAVLTAESGSEPGFIENAPPDVSAYSARIKMQIQGKCGFRPAKREIGKLVHNIGGLRYLQGSADHIKPVRVEYGGGRSEGLTDRFVPMVPWKMQLSLAESMAHGATHEFYFEGYFQADCYDNSPQAAVRLEAICKYHNFIEDNEDFFPSQKTSTKTAILVDDDSLSVEMLKRICDCNLIFNVLHYRHISDQINDYDLLIIPDYLGICPALSDCEWKKISDWLRPGRNLILSKDWCKIDDRYCPRKYVPVVLPEEQVSVLQEPIEALLKTDEGLNSFINYIDSIHPAQVKLISDHNSIKYNLLEGDGFVFLHVVNYKRKAQQAVQLSFKDAVKLVDFKSPDGNIKCDFSNGILEIDSITRYAIFKFEI